MYVLTISSKVMWHQKLALQFAAILEFRKHREDTKFFDDTDTWYNTPVGRDKNLDVELLHLCK